MCYLSVQKENGKEVIVESDKPLENMETRSMNEHLVRALVHETRLFAGALKKIAMNKIKLYPSLHFVDEQMMPETGKVR